MEKTKLLAVVGPTASGKTKLAVSLAQKYDGEVVSCDSMQIYKSMDIATAKPTREEMGGIAHHLIDFVDLNHSFSVSEYVLLAHKTIDDIKKRGKLPILAGGTGLYYMSLIDNLTFSEEECDLKLRDELLKKAKADGGEKLHSYLKSIDPQAAKEIHPNNLVRLVRAVEVYETTGITLTEHKKRSRQTPSPYEPYVIGLSFNDRQKLYDRINLRVDMMMSAGLLKEAKEILSKDHIKTAYNAIGYKELEAYFNGEVTLEEAVDTIKKESRHYAKRQLTWFRKDKRINWINVDEYDDFCEVIKKSCDMIENARFL